MPEPIDNYIARTAAGAAHRQAFCVWSIFTIIAALWVFMILLAPVAEANNLTGVSRAIYNFCAFICHQIPERSFHFGEHAFAVCSRCFGVYLGILSGSLVYYFLRPIERSEPLPRFWLFLAMLPMAIDWALGIFGIWENTHFSRFVSGLILGAACAIFIIPALIEIFALSSNRNQIKKLSP